MVWEEDNRCRGTWVLQSNDLFKAATGVEEKLLQIDVPLIHLAENKMARSGATNVQ